MADRARVLVRGVRAVPDAPETGLPREVRAALGGQYGAATRPTPGQRSLTLHSALPIRDGDRVTGAVVVSQSTWRILQALYATRLRIFQVVVASVVLAALLSVLMAATVVGPLVRLRRAATAVAQRRDALPGTFRGAERRDEIGDLARALEELTRRRGSAESARWRAAHAAPGRVSGSILTMGAPARARARNRPPRGRRPSPWS